MMDNLDKQQIFTYLLAKSQFFEELGVKKLGLFGSYVRGEQQKHSDLDFLIEFQEGQKTYDHFIQVAFHLEDTFQRKVDLVTPEALSPHIRPWILKEVEYVALTP